MIVSKEVRIDGPLKERPTEAAELVDLQLKLRRQARVLQHQDRKNLALAIESLIFEILALRIRVVDRRRSMGRHRINADPSRRTARRHAAQA